MAPLFVGGVSLFRQCLRKTTFDPIDIKPPCHVCGACRLRLETENDADFLSPFGPAVPRHPSALSAAMIAMIWPRSMHSEDLGQDTPSLRQFEISIVDRSSPSCGRTTPIPIPQFPHLAGAGFEQRVLPTGMVIGIVLFDDRVAVGPAEAKTVHAGAPGRLPRIHGRGLVGITKCDP